MVLFSALDTISDPILYYLVNGAIIIFGLTLLMLIQVISFRLYSVHQNKVTQQAKKIWRPILAESMLSYPENLPRLARKHRHVLLHEWNLFYATLRGEARQRLQKLARKVHLDHIAHDYVASRNISKQLQGIITLGHLQDYAIWNELVDLVHSTHSVLSLTAAQALVDIDSRNAIPLLLPHIIRRKDWPVARVAMLFNTADPGALSRAIKRTIKDIPEKDIPQLLRFLDSSAFDPEIAELYQQLGNSHNTQIVSACIQAAKDAQGLELARRHAGHPQWYIRLHVARTLGRLGTRDDFNTLVRMMSDPEWWVRYRSAQALTRMPCIDNDELQQLHTLLDDRYARDILQQAMTEREWA